jgi:hypothetical protein
MDGVLPRLVLGLSSAPFEINDDNEILKRLELRKASQEELAEYVPPQLLRYVPPEVYGGEGASGPQDHQLPGTLQALASASTTTAYLDNGQQVRASRIVSCRAMSFTQQQGQEVLTGPSVCAVRRALRSWAPAP